MYQPTCSNLPILGGTVTLTLSGPVTIESSNEGSLTPTVNGNVLTYTVTDFNNMPYAPFKLKLKTDTTATADDVICVHVNIQPDQADADTSDNEYDFCYNVVNSYDPNEKEVFPKDVPPGYVDWLTYTIHFQNTGNAPAFNIRLKDTLDTNLDLSTFEFRDASHAASTNLNGRVLTVRFNNIMLPDSTSDLEGSMGYFQYRIKPKPNLADGIKVKNKARIYFDYNTAIITNTTENLFTCISNVQQSFTICNGDSVQVGSNWYSTSGTYIDSLTSTMACDSIVTTYVNVFVIDTTLSVINDSIIAQSGYTLYKWKDCVNDSTLQSSSSNVFVAEYNGSFKVTITDLNNCDITSSCVDILTTALQSENVSNEIMVMPNPAHDEFKLYFNTLKQASVKVNIQDVSGRIVIQSSDISTGKYARSYDVSNLSRGIYFIQIEVNDNKLSKKLVIE
jgi:hypothetical protein